ALVASDGSIDWLCLPDVDSGAVFGRLLDAERGGSFRLEPTEPFESEHCYRPESNVLETTFRTASGAVRVTDAMTLADRTFRSPLRELVRRVDGLAGTVPMRWVVDARFDYGRRPARVERRGDRYVLLGRRDALAVKAWDAGTPAVVGTTVEGEFAASEGAVATLTLAAAHQEPLVYVRRSDAEQSLERTDRFWRAWAGRATYDGSWRAAVVRSALALKLLVYAPSGAIVAAPTTSLPEEIGGSRNWDYRFAWIRDAAWTLDALLRLGYDEEANAFFWWLMHASRISLPRLNVLYRVDGGTHLGEDDLDGLDGYRGSRPVRVGNGAAGQLQLDIYGAALDGIWRFACERGGLDRHTGRDVARIADWVCAHWRERDNGIWEARSGRAHYTQSKAMCWLALDRAAKLAERGWIPDRRERWTEQASQVQAFYQREGWSEERGSYVRAPDLQELDASLLVLSLFGCEEASSPRVLGT